MWRARLSIFYAESLSCGESVWRAGLSIFYAESLSCGEACVRSQTQFLDTESLVVYIVSLGRLSKSLLSLWRRLSCSYTEPPLVVYISEEESDSANPC